MISLILDGLVILLLAATIVYCIILNRRLALLRKNEGELHVLIASFNQATARAEAGIGSLKKAADGVRDSLRSQIEDAKALCDELSFIIERGDTLAARIGGAISNTRSESVDKEEGKSRPAADTERARGDRTGPEDGEAALRSRAERELFKALNMSR